MDFDSYMKSLESLGDSILNWSDPERNFRGYTEVRRRRRRHKWYPADCVDQ